MIGDGDRDRHQLLLTLSNTAAPQTRRGPDRLVGSDIHYHNIQAGISCDPDRWFVVGINVRAKAAKAGPDFVQHQLRDSAVTMHRRHGVRHVFTIYPERRNRLPLQLEDEEVWLVHFEASIEPTQMLIPSHNVLALGHSAGRFVVAPFEQPLGVILAGRSYSKMVHDRSPAQPRST